MRPRITSSPCPKTGKAKYVTKERAERAVLAHVVTGSIRSDTYVYLCPDCGWWHRTRHATRPGSSPDPKFLVFKIEEAEAATG